MIRTINYINTIFTQVVNEYLQTGWIIYTQSMSGSQGEKARIDLTNGNKVYRILMATGSEHVDGTHWGVDTLEIEVRAFDIPQNSGRTLWNNEGALIKDITFYKVEGMRRRNRTEVYVDTRAEITEIINKQYDRCRDCYDVWKEVEIRPAYLDKIRDMCRHNRGYGKVKRAMIAKLEKSSRGEYRVEFTAESGKQRLIIKKIGG